MNKPPGDDAIRLLDSLFVAGSQAPLCLDSCDANDDGLRDVADAIYTISALFVPGSPQLSAPGPTACGIDPTGETLTCSAYAPCP